MKKAMCLVLALVMLCSLCACGKKEVEAPQKDNTATAEKQPEKATEKATEVATEPAEEEEELEKFKLPLMEVYCKLPEEYAYSRLTNFSVSVASGEAGFILSICCGDEGSYSGSTKDIFEFLREDYTSDVNKYLSPNADEQTWDLTYTEGATISGYEATKITGTVGHTYDGDTYEVYGYSAIIEDRPVLFLGILGSESWEKDGFIDKYQPEEDRETMVALVEQMVGSIFFWDGKA